MDFKQKINEISCKEDFVKFVESLSKDLTCNPSEWENKQLSDYLDAIASWTEDNFEGYYQYNNMQIPQEINWKIFANILIAAKMYE